MTATLPSLDALAGMLRTHQAASGAFPACPSFSQYPYSWLRDSSFIAYALDCAGDHAAAGDYHRWAARTIAAQAGRVQELIRQRAQGQPIEDSAFLPTRFALSGEALGDDWPNFQLDGYGQWLWSLGEHLKLRGLTELPEEFAPGVHVTLDYLRAFWKEPCYDCWEEFPYRWHTSTLASIFGGLRQMAAFFPDLDALAAEIRAFTMEQAVTSGQLNKFIGYPEVDASLLWTAVPFGLLELDDPVFTRTLSAIERDLLRGGVHRYARDTYYGGGSWVLLTAWLGWVYARQGRAEDAARLLNWVRAQDQGNGLPEQTTEALLCPEYLTYWQERWGESARPLLWSHAMHLILEAEVHALSPTAGVPS